MTETRKPQRSVVEKLSLGDGALRMMQNVFGGGAAKRPAPIDREKLERSIAHVNKRFGLNLRMTDAAFNELAEELPWIAGQFEGDTPTVTKRHLKTRLTRLRSHVQGAIQLLKPVRAMDQEEAGELEFVLFLFAAIADHKSEATGLPARARLETILAQFEEVLGYCDYAESKLPSLKAKTGRRSMAFYDDFVILMVRLRGSLGSSTFQPRPGTRGTRRRPRLSPLSSTMLSAFFLARPGRTRRQLVQLASKAASRSWKPPKKRVATVTR